VHDAQISNSPNVLYSKLDNDDTYLIFKETLEIHAYYIINMVLTLVIECITVNMSTSCNVFRIKHYYYIFKVELYVLK
jgi:hypothetical protein